MLIFLMISHGGRLLKVLDMDFTSALPWMNCKFLYGRCVHVGYGIMRPLPGRTMMPVTLNVFPCQVIFKTRFAKIPDTRILFDETSLLKCLFFLE